MNADAAAVLIAAILTHGIIQVTRAGLSYRAGKRRDQARKAGTA